MQKQNSPTPHTASAEPHTDSAKIHAGSAEPHTNPAGRLLKGLVIVLLLILPDQLTKQLAVRSLASGKSIPLIPGVLELTFVRNRGAAFGILQDARLFFFVITLAALLVIGFVYARVPSGRRYLPMRICLCLIAAGAIGNLIDRAALSYVRDFIYFRLIDFPVFNVADIYITCATFAMLFLSLFYYKNDDDFAFLSRKH